jgi:hypothetical protein
MMKAPAVVPMPTPTTTRASGCATAMKITNGIGRKKFTTKLRSAAMTRFCSSPPGRVT